MQQYFGITEGFSGVHVELCEMQGERWLRWLRFGSGM
jgi:hypothetical protein